MKNLLTALLCRLLVAAFCSSSLSSSVVEAAPRELEDGGGGGGADKGKDANKTTRPNEPSGDAGWLAFKVVWACVISKTGICY